MSVGEKCEGRKTIHCRGEKAERRTEVVRRWADTDIDRDERNVHL